MRNSVTDNSIRLCLFFLTVKTAALYLVSIKSYVKNAIGSHFVVCRLVNLLILITNRNESISKRYHSIPHRQLYLTPAVLLNRCCFLRFSRSVLKNILCVHFICIAGKANALANLAGDKLLMSISFVFAFECQNSL